MPIIGELSSLWEFQVMIFIPCHIYFDLAGRSEEISHASAEIEGHVLFEEPTDTRCSKLFPAVSRIEDHQRKPHCDI